MAERNLNILINAKDNASKALGGLGNALEKNKATIQKTTLAATAAFGAVTAAIGATVKSYAKAGDEIQKMALRTGFSTVALSELKHAAELSGASIDDIEKSVKKMAQGLLQAETAESLASRGMELLGVALDDFQEMSPEEVFFAFAGAIGDIEDPLRRSALASEIFGKSGTNLLPMLASGSKGIAEMRKEAHALGIVFDEDAANAAALFNDNMDRLNKQMTGVKNQIAMAFIPILIEVAEALREPLARVMEWVKENPTLVRTIVGVTLAVTGLVAVMGMLTLLFMAFNPVTLIIVGALAGIGFAFVAVNNLLKAFGTTWGGVWEGIKNITKGAVNFVIDFIESMINSYISALNAVIRAINKVASSASSIPGFGRMGKINISEVQRVEFGRVGGGEGTNVTVNVMGDVSGEELVNKVSNGVISQLTNNVRVTAF